MKQTNKKEFSKFLNKFEKLLDYNFELLDSKIELNLFDGNTDNFLKTSNCKFSLSTEYGQIFLKILFFDKNNNEIFSKIDLSDVGMQKYNFFKNETHGKDNYKLYKKFVRVAITKFDFLYNNLNSSNKQADNSSNSYLNALNTLFDLLIHGTLKTQVEPDHLLILVDSEERNRIFGEASYFFSSSSLSETFETVVRKIEVSTFKYNKFEKSDIISLLNILNLIDKNKNYDNFTKKLNLVCIFIKELKQTTKFKLEESNHRNIYSFVRDIVTNKANNLIVSSIDQERFRYNGKRYTSELKVSDLKSIFRLVAKK